MNDSTIIISKLGMAVILKMKDFRPEIITRPLFVIGLGTLLTNDLYLKYEFSNVWTGKLSDITGLFIFPYFFSAFKANFRKQIYLFTAGLFVFWKSPFSQDIINWWNSIGINIYRTVDYSDLLALAILPFSYRYFTSEFVKQSKIKKPLIIAFSITSIFAFCATTLPRAQVKCDIDTNKSYELAMSKTDFFNTLTAGHSYSNTLEKNLVDTLFYLTFNIPDHNAQVKALARVKTLDPGHITVSLDSILFGYITGGLFSGVDKDDIEKFKAIKAQDFENYFEKNFIVRVKDKKAKHLYYDSLR